MSKHKYSPRIPRYAAGIRLHDPRLAFSRNWWGRRWLESLEEMRLQGRFGRGKLYALSGQVLSLESAGSTVTARVLGMRSDPYTVTLRFRNPGDGFRARIVAALRAEPALVARLADDDLPFEVADLFRREETGLFPGGRLAPGSYDVTTDCTCPDYANPCKHSVAALMILGEEVARRPATLLELRGIRLEELYES